MRPRRLVLLPLAASTLDPGLLDWLGRELAAALGLGVTRAEIRPLRPAWGAGAPGRLLADAILDDLVLHDHPDDQQPVDHWVLALTDADLAAPDRPYVFGAATVGGGWAVVGLARLADPTPGVLRLRALKEALHELGHLAGLGHCATPACVMRESATVADTDRKLADFCPACADHLAILRRT